jgi:Flp pilus assembly protein TadD
VSIPGPGVRLVAISALTIALCSFALSVVLPSLAASKASSALVEAASSSPGAVKHALAAAKLAGSLDPLSDAGPRVEATIAARAHDWDTAVSSLLDAVRREPTDAQAWRQLTFVELGRGDRADALRAARRVLELDPRGPSGATIAGNLGEVSTVTRTPPSGSATAQP